MVISLDPVRRRIRTRLSGAPDGLPDWVRAVGSVGEGPGWFEPDGVVWRVHGDLATLVGGVTALIGQAAHPLALAGVDQHSSYRDDPWKRLAGTARWLVISTFGSAQLAEREAARVRGMHRRVVGTAPDGRPYAAGDPELLRWVHIAFTDAFLHAHLHVGADLRSRFGPHWPDTYVAEWARAAEPLGASDLPRSTVELDEAIRAVRGELADVPEDLRRFLMSPPGLSLPEQPVYRSLATAAGLLTHPVLAERARVPGRSVLAGSRRAQATVAAVRLELLGLRLVLGPRGPAENLAHARVAAGPRDGA